MDPMIAIERGNDPTEDLFRFLQDRFFDANRKLETVVNSMKNDSTDAINSQPHHLLNNAADTALVRLQCCLQYLSSTSSAERDHVQPLIQDCMIRLARLRFGDSTGHRLQRY